MNHTPVAITREEALRFKYNALRMYYAKLVGAVFQIFKAIV